MRSKLSNVLLAIALALCSAGLFNACSHEHVYANQITEPTCLEQGYTTYTCSCGDSYVADYVNALDHIFTKYVSDNNATYKSDGTKTAHCDRTGCTATDTVTDVGSKLQSGISFNTLTVDGESVFGKVSNATETFSFIDEIKTVGEMKFIVSLDIYGTQQVVSKKIPLSIGDNIVYVIELLDNEPKNVYTVNVRRRPIHNVTFYTNNGSKVDSQRIEEDSCASIPTQIPTRTGYTFDKWNYDFTKPIAQNTTITASWIANKDTPYKVEYYLQNLEDDNYTFNTSENKTGTTDTTATATIKTFEHFTYNESASTISGNINGNGNTVLKVYYTRNSYIVTFDGNGGTIKSGNTTQSIKYGGSASAPTFEKTDYTFDKWDKPLANVSEDITINAVWKINQYTLTIVYGNGQENKVITQDYNSAIDFVLPINLQKTGYTFDGFDKNIPSTMPAYNMTITAKWLAIFYLSGGVITGLTDHGRILSKIIIPQSIDGVSVTSIGDSAFYVCRNLTSITIPNSVTSIGDRAFYVCDSLTSITVDKDNSNYSSVDGILYNKGQTAIIHIPKAISGSVTIPSSVTSIGDSAFYGCSSLTSITVDKDNSNYSSVDGILYNKGQTAIIHIPKAISGSVTIPSSVTSIGHNAFYDCESLTSITIPNSVTSIGSYAFYGCSSLTSVTFANPNNWHINNSVSYFALTNIVQNATYLKDSYCEYYWFRSV